MLRLSLRASSTIRHGFGVVGAGQMGTGIAIVAALKNVGPKVFLIDKFPEQIAKAKLFCETWAAKEIAKNRISEEQKTQLFEKIVFSDLDTQKWDQIDFVVEAVPENLEIKKEVFQLLDQKTSKSIILATNTSSISITEMGSFTSRPDRVVGMHFMNPAPIMKGVELIKGLGTSRETMETASQIIRQMEKQVFVCQKDRAGFLVNRILMPYINEAIFALQDEIGTKEDIDLAMRLSTNVPMGPLTLADFIGLDTCLSIMQTLYREFQDSKYRPAPLLKNYVAVGWLGKKSRRGFFTYK